MKPSANSDKFRSRSNLKPPKLNLEMRESFDVMKKQYFIEKLDGHGADQQKLLQMVQRRTFQGLYRNSSISVIDDKPKPYMPNDTADEMEKNMFPTIVQHSQSQPKLKLLSKIYRVRAELETETKEVE